MWTSRHGPIFFFFFFPLHSLYLFEERKKKYTYIKGSFFLSSFPFILFLFKYNYQLLIKFWLICIVEDLSNKNYQGTSFKIFGLKQPSLYIRCHRTNVIIQPQCQDTIIIIVQEVILVPQEEIA